MKRLIFFSYDMNIGGMEKALLLLLNQLVKEYDVSLVLEKKRGELLRQLDGRVKVSEYRVSQFWFAPVRKVINFLHRFFWVMSHYHKYDFSCSYATYSVIGSRLALAASLNSVLYVHSNYYDYYKGNVERIQEFFQMLSAQKFRKVLFVSIESQQKLKEIVPYMVKESRVINNLVDYQGILDRAAENKSVSIPNKSSQTIFLFVGRLEEESKRLSRLLQAFSLAYTQNQNIELWIIGDGKDYSLCSEFIQKYELQKSVKLFGMQINPYPYIKAADCVILTSDFEGYPVIYNECMVLGKPFITTIPVSDKYIDIRKYATLVEKNVKKIAQAILDFKGEKYPGVDFVTINEKRVDEIKEIIDGK